MSRYMTKLSAKELLAQWSSAGIVAPASYSEIETFTLSRFQERELPLYLRILVGVGAFISSVCFIAFLAVSEIINFQIEFGLIVWGLVFVGTAIYFARGHAHRENALMHSFVMQTSFCLIGVGKILFVMGFAQLCKPHEGWGVTLATILISAATYHVYRMSIDRFLSALVVLISILVNVVSDRDLADSIEFTLNIIFLAQLALAAFLFTSAKVSRNYVPLAYALAVSLCIFVLFLSTQSEIGYQTGAKHFSLIPISIALTITFIALIGWISGDIKRLLTEALLLACLGAVALGCIAAPGIILSIMLLILGHGKHERLLVLMGALLMPFFIVLYYYNLDVSLMFKSGILALSGMVLLAGRWYMSVRKLDREEVI